MNELYSTKVLRELKTRGSSRRRKISVRVYALHLSMPCQDTRRPRGAGMTRHEKEDNDPSLFCRGL